MVMRIEDIDQGRCKVELRDEILRDLAWLGLDWDEGPDVGGAYGPYLQSERSALYLAAIEQLSTYGCTCSRAQLAKDPGPACKRCRAAGAMPTAAGKAALRWPLPDVLPEFVDLRLGAWRVTERLEIDDPVLLGRDGRSRYTLAVVVDDAAMQIDTVCRGADLLGDTHRQIALAQALGYAIPSYFHLPLVLGPDGEKLSKSKGAPCLHTLREQGSKPGELVASLAHSCGLLAPQYTSISPRELLGEIDLARLYAVASQPPA